VKSLLLFRILRFNLFQCSIGIEYRTMICFSYAFNQTLNESTHSPLKRDKRPIRYELGAPFRKSPFNFCGELKFLSSNFRWVKNTISSGVCANESLGALSYLSYLLHILHYSDQVDEIRGKTL